MTTNFDIVDNLHELYSFLSDIGVAEIGEKYPFNYIHTDSSSWPNAVYLKGDVSDLTYDSIVGLKELMVSGECPRLLFLNEDQINDQVGEILRENLFLPTTVWTNMISGKEDMLCTEDKPGNLDIKVIDNGDSTELSHWIEIVEHVLFKNQRINPDIFREGIRANSLKLIIGYCNGTPAATSLLFTGTLAGVYMVATMPTFRRRGLGKIVLSYTMDIAKKWGYESIVLQSTKEGFEFYQSVGFETFSRVFLFYQIQK